MKLELGIKKYALVPWVSKDRPDTIYVAHTEYPMPTEMMFDVMHNLESIIDGRGPKWPSALQGGLAGVFDDIRYNEDFLGRSIYSEDPAAGMSKKFLGGEGYEGITPHIIKGIVPNWFPGGYAYLRVKNAIFGGENVPPEYRIPLGLSLLHAGGIKIIPLSKKALKRNKMGRGYGLAGDVDEQIKRLKKDAKKRGVAVDVRKLMELKRRRAKYRRGDI